MTDPAVQIAVLETKLETVERDMELMRANIETLVKGQQEILAKLNEAKGGWKTLMWLGGAAASAGGGVSWLITHVRFTP